MQRTAQRILGYTGTAAVVGALVWAGFLRKEDPHVLTMLGSVDVQLRLASGMPAKDQAGKPVAVRQQLIDEAKDWLDRVDAQEPGLTSAFEYRAYIAYLEGDFAHAAALYGEATTKQDCTPKLRQSLLVKQCRMLIAAGQASDAIEVLDSPSFDGGPQATRRLTRAKALHAMGKREESIKVAQAAVSGAGEDVQVLVDIGGFYERVAEHDAAEAAYAKAAEHDAIANYFLARLKLRRGEIDRSFELLERAVRAGSSRVVMLVREDQADWKPWQGKPEFEKVFRPADKAAQPGR